MEYDEDGRPVRGTDARPFTSEEGDGSARWSPDGRWIAFTRAARSEDDGGPGGDGRQLWVIRTDGGEARQLTRHATSVQSYDWTPDARRIVFVAEDTVPEAERDARKEGSDAVFVNEGPNGQTRGSYSNLWWVPVDFDSVEARPITTGNRLIGDFAVSPDGRRVAFTFRTENHRNDSHRSEIALVPLEGGEIRVLTSNEAPESGLLWTPDGRSLLFVAPSLETWELDQGNRYLMSVDDGGTRQLMPESTLDIHGEAFTADGRFLDFVGLDGTVDGFYRLDLRTGRVRKLSDWDGVIGSPTWSTDHGVVAFTHETPTSPAEVTTAPYRERMTPTAVTDVHADIRRLYLERFAVIIEDEAQDSSRLLQRFKELSGNGGRVA